MQNLVRNIGISTVLMAFKVCNVCITRRFPNQKKWYKMKNEKKFSAQKKFKNVWIWKIFVYYLYKLHSTQSLDQNQFQRLNLKSQCYSIFEWRVVYNKNINFIFVFFFVFKKNLSRDVNSLILSDLTNVFVRRFSTVVQKHSLKKDYSLLSPQIT